MNIAPQLAIIVVVYNMRREAPRTLYSLSSSYQLGVNETDYQVIVVENGSTDPLDPTIVRGFGKNFQYFYINNALPSPATAINFGVNQVLTQNVGVMIDGARIVSPGAIRLTLNCLAGFERAIVGTIGFHLGPDVQMKSIEEGYNIKTEDYLLASIDWEHDGYKLFEISSLAGSSKLGWFGPLPESNLISLPRTLFDELGGYDLRFDLPGGGLVNIDFYERASSLPNTSLITLLGEGTFHQIHNGISTNRSSDENKRLWLYWLDQFEKIRGVPYRRPKRQAILVGSVSPSVLPWITRSCELAASP